MGAKYAQHTRVRRSITPQTEAIPGREAEMIENAAGGVVFDIGPWAALDRFLILGTEGGTYYASERDLTKASVVQVNACITEDGPRAVARVVEISQAGRAPKNDPALLVLALCAASTDLPTRQAAMRALPLVARIGTHLFHFAEYVNALRGWGSALKRGVGDWYKHRSVDALAFQAVKYQQRDGWSHRDLLRLAHPKFEAEDLGRRAVADWICKRRDDLGDKPMPAIIRAFDEMAKSENVADVLRIIQAFEANDGGEGERGFPREAIPTQWLSDGRVMGMLLRNMPMMAMIRNLGTMSKLGILGPLTAGERLVVTALGDKEKLHKARIHPFSILLALKTYASGRGFRGGSSWEVNRKIVDALDRAFYMAFANVVPTGKRYLLGLDVSGSMGSEIQGSNITCREAVGALAMVTARTEPWTHMIGFSAAANGRLGRMGTGITEITFGAADSLEKVCQTMAAIPFGSTDCSLPITYAMERNLEVDVFVVMTDNETYAGNIQPSEALKQYRKKMGINAKMIVVGMTATSSSIADPKDAGMLDVVGFDSALPDILSSFAAA